MESRGAAVSAYVRLLVYAALRPPKLPPSSLRAYVLKYASEGRGAVVRVPLFKDICDIGP